MSYQVKVDVSPIYELLNSFMVYVTRRWVRSLDLGPEWIENIDSTLSLDVRESIRAAAAWPFSDYDVLFAWTALREQTSEVQPFLEEMAGRPIEELFQMVRPLLPDLTVEQASRIRDHYIPLLQLWDKHYYQSLLPEYRKLIEEDSSEKELLLTKMSPDRLVDYATAGLIVEDIPGLKKIILFPTVHNRPINMYCFYEGMLLIQYPVDVPEERDDEPPVSLLRLTEAISDPERLRLLRYISNQPKSIKQMSSELGQSEEFLRPHLMALRVSGLLQTHLGEDQSEKYSLRTDGLSELNMYLEAYIQI
ncbi:ArsR family transcriptional regulator [Paenibacillus urinalis]|uniref:ArsR family transcriptional regulator n=1 Tax=Paenibacillus urinalis TaxID=521520 RepID=A0AAX3MXH8_9BACL|nr:ArsR family transcriptional regulator [Paenibacillus urinalis]WDH81074.1 ArsR family transcriptional regulator [Paenibacillus urinalis]